MTEEWRPVAGWEGLYEVSSLGRVRSLDRVIRTKKSGGTTVRAGQELKPRIVNRYPRVALRNPKDSTQKYLFVHRLIAIAFIPNPHNLAIVRHLNDIPTDNRLDNIAWGTHSDNENDKVRNGRSKQANQTHCKRGHPFTEENTRITSKGRRQCRACDKLRQEISIERRRARNDSKLED